MSKILIDEAVVRQALAYIIATSEHDQLCDVLDLDEDGLHKPCSCLLQDVLDDLRAALAEQPAQQEPLTDEELALSLLETLFDAYENGVPCYEDPETADGYIGHAFRLDDETFHACADLLNRRRPRAHGIGGQS